MRVCKVETSRFRNVEKGGVSHFGVEPRNVLSWLIEQIKGNDQNKELVPLILREQCIRTSRRPSSTKWH